MIRLKFELVNPCIDRFRSIYCHTGATPFKHKFWEVQVMRTTDIVSIDLQVTTRQDHAGIELWLGLFGFSINMQIYDNRHWNHQEGRWMFYTEEEGLH